MEELMTASYILISLIKVLFFLAEHEFASHFHCNETGELQPVVHQLLKR